MKGTTTTDALSTIAIVVVLVILLFLIPQILAQIRGMFVSESPRIVSRDLAGIATIMAASPYDMQVNYSTNSKYNINFEDKFVTVDYSDIDWATEEESKIRMAVLITESFENVNLIVFEKISGNIDVDAYGE
jgi:hypothetical protein